jgi:hypothetical protein
MAVGGTSTVGPIIVYASGEGTSSIPLPTGVYTVVGSSGTTGVQSLVIGSNTFAANANSTAYLSASSLQVTAGSLTTWTTRTSGFGATNINAATFGNGVYVAIGNSQTIRYSADAITWNTPTYTPIDTTGGSSGFRSIIYSNGYFVGIGLSRSTNSGPPYYDPVNSIHYITSTDGITWSSSTFNHLSSATYYAIAAGNNRYVIVGDNSEIAYSTSTPFSWTRVTNASANHRAITFGNNLFVVGGTQGALHTSTDAITWTTRTSGFGTSQINALTFGNGIYVAAGAAGTLTTSTNGTTWTTRTSGFGTTNIFGLTYSNGSFVAVGDAGQLRSSTDGITWTSRTSGFGTSAINAVTGNLGVFVAGGAAGTITTTGNFSGMYWTITPVGTNSLVVTIG